MKHILAALADSQQSPALPKCNPWLEYERRKREFSAANPGVTPEAYEAFIEALTKELDL